MKVIKGILGIRIFISDKTSGKHNCFKEVTEKELNKFLLENPGLIIDNYMGLTTWFDVKMQIVAKYSEQENARYIRNCFVKHRSKPRDKNKGHWQYIKCQTNAALSINSRENK